MLEIIVFWPNPKVKMPRNVVFRPNRKIKVPLNSKIFKKSLEIKMPRKFHALSNKYKSKAKAASVLTLIHVLAHVVK